MIAAECSDARSVLDVGCGTGYLLERLGRGTGLECVGLELNAERAALARERTGYDVHEVPIEDFAPGRTFDVITLINVFSHVPSIDRLFTAVRRLLSPRGKLVLKVGEYTNDVRKSDMFDWSIPDHLHFLGMNTIAHLCDRFSFEVIRHRRVPLGEDLFTAERFRSPGRSQVRNALKRVSLATPGALALMRLIHKRRTGGRVYSSFVVVQPVNVAVRSHEAVNAAG